VVPGFQVLAERGQAKSSEDFRIGFEVTGGAGEQGAGAALISATVMVQADGNLDERLQEFLLRSSRLTPNILEHFVGREEVRLVEQLDSQQEVRLGHVSHFGTRATGIPG